VQISQRSRADEKRNDGENDMNFEEAIEKGRLASALESIESSLTKIGEDIVTKLDDSYEVIIEDEPEKLKCEWRGTKKASDGCTGKNLTSFYHHGETRLMTLCNECREKSIIQRFADNPITSFDL
jgi:hypothetical protein